MYVLDMNQFQRFIPQSQTNQDASNDAFCRLRISQPFTMFDSQNRYALSNLFFSNTVSGATIANITTESTANLIINTTTSSAIRQSKYYFPYQPGKSLMTMFTFCMAPAQPGLVTQRVGYFDDQNGIFFEVSDSTYIVKRNNGQDTKIQQLNWNSNSLLVLDPTRVQIFFIDIEWLGVGTVRTGFFLDGVPVMCHKFHHANILNSVYMKTACLPVRYQIFNTGLARQCGLKQICSTVISEGGYDPKSGYLYMQNTPSVSIPQNTITPIMSITLDPNYLGVVAYIKRVCVISATNGDIGYWYIYLNPTLTGASFTSHASSFAVMYDTSATVLSGGRIINGGIFSTTANVDYSFEEQIQLGLKDINASDIMTLAVSRVNNGSSSVLGMLQWTEI